MLRSAEALLKVYSMVVMTTCNINKCNRCPHQKRNVTS